MSWISLQELKRLSQSDVVQDLVEPQEAVAVEQQLEVTPIIERTAEVAPPKTPEQVGKPITVHEISGFDRLSACGDNAFSVSDVTSWLRGCRESGIYPLALPCDGRVFADVRESAFSNAWVIGDVHGDFDALAAAFAFADEWTSSHSADAPALFSLGDLFDRGDKSLEVLLKFLGEAIKRPGRVGWIAGNHDWGFRFDQQRGIFASTTYPNEFTMWMNAHLDDAALVAFGQEVAAICGKLPSAAVIPGGVLLVHGGVPHRDLQERIVGIVALEDSDMLHDFIWNRFHDSLRRKRPSREANCQIGVQDVLDFLSIMENNCRVPCKAILRGHDHFAERIRIFDAYAPCTVVTLNTCSTLKDGAYSASPLDFTPPAIVHCLNGNLEAFKISK
ncbi:MAG: metallophosphoesterase [Victivallales bacterium]|nr:metallophosphoesterase [Victivallales bacterium]